MSRPAHYGKWGQRGKLVQEHVPPKHCRWCGDPIPKGSRRTSYCSADCYRECWLRISWPTMRAHIMGRDKTCRICDGVSYKRSYLYGMELVVNPVYKNGKCIVKAEYAKYTGIEFEWHVDHVTPVAEGGTDDPANLRLLCGKCHKRITKEWHGQRAAKRRESLPHTMAMQL